MTRNEGSDGHGAREHAREKAAALGDLAFRSGFVAVLGRPNVGKSSLLNAIVGEKVSISAQSPNTTRTQVRAVLHGEGHQIVFIDTPGIHKPRSALGFRLNEAAAAAADDVDCCVVVLDATAPIGRGDRFVAARLPADAVVVCNKADLVSRASMLSCLDHASHELGLSEAEYFPVSAKTGEGTSALVEHLVARLPLGPRYYPDEVVRDLPDGIFVAELVREQLLGELREELPHSVACQVTDWNWPYIRCEILVERASQKGIVVGKNGALLKRAGTAARAQLPAGAYLELFVRVEKDWQQRHDALERLGL